ncbi:MAG: pyruvate kinase [Acidobacteria bacterium]|nr:pyruvate kinase [Acidobacteriota bacterium]
MIRRTKIVATLGPASSSPAAIRALITAGMNVARITLAHGTRDAQRALVAAVRAEADALGQPVAVMVDLPGPKVRTTGFGEPAQLAPGDLVTLVAGHDEPSTAARFVVDYDTLAADVRPGDVLGIGDGIVHLAVERIAGDEVHARVTNGGTLVGRKGVRVPTERFRAAVPTAEDLELIAAFRDDPVDIIAISFVRSGADVRAVRAAVGGGGPWLMAKIETAPAVHHLAEIIAASDAIMVARGDLGTELPIEDVPHLQKRIIRETVRNGKPVLVATQMLESMIEAPTPTRAEATDVANAVLDQASAVMLSAETAVGHDPVLVVETMDRLARRAEAELTPASLQSFVLGNRDLSDVNVATAHAAWQAAHDLDAQAILCCTRTGATARKMASFRPLAPLYGLTGDVQALRRLSLCWGVQPMLLSGVAASTEEVMDRAIAEAVGGGLARPGDIVVVLAGSPRAGPGHTDSLRVAVIPRAGATP